MLHMLLFEALIHPINETTTCIIGDSNWGKWEEGGKRLNVEKILSSY